MKILVTGATGTLGRPLCEELQQRGHEVHGVSLKHHSGKGLDSFYRADIADLAQINTAIDKVRPDVVYNLAAEFGRLNGELYNPQLWRTNATGFKNLLDCERGFGFKLIHASSSEIYGTGPWDSEVFDEDMTKRIVINPHNDYAMSKVVNEVQIRNHISNNPSTDILTLRFFNAYGPGERYHPFRSVVALFCYCALYGLPFTVYKNYYRVFMYIDDFIPTLANAATTPTDTGEVINIGGVEYCNIEHLYDIIKSEVPDLDARFLEQDQHNTVSKRPSIARASMILGHNPTITLDVGVPKTLEWMRGVYG